jgi:hypothetical protein
MTSTASPGFDELVEADIGIAYPTLPNDKVDPGPLGTLLIILRGRLNAAQYGEDGVPERDPKRRPDLDDLWPRLHNLEERRQHSLRAFRQESRTLAGLAHRRLRYFASKLNPDPFIIETEKDERRLIEQAIRDFGSPERVVQKIANAERLDAREEREAQEVATALTAEVDRLHRELTRRIAIAPWWRKAPAALAQHPIVAGVIAAVVGGLILALVLS